MAVITCGTGGSTTGEHVARTNQNTTDIATKITKVSGGTENNITTLTADGQVQDGGASIAEVRDTDTHTDGTTNGVYTLAERAKLATLAPVSEDTRKIMSQDYIFTAVGGETFLTGEDDNGQVLDLNTGDVAGYKDRLRLHTSDDLQATSQTRVDLTVPLVATEKVIIHTSDYQEPSLFNIEYSMAAFKVLDGETYIKDFSRPYYHAIANASNFIYLDNQSVPYPVLHDLGTDTKQTATLGTGWVDNTGHSYTATNATSDLSALSTATTNNVLIDFTISNYTAGDVNGKSVNGTYQVSVTNDSLTGTSFSGDVLINSVQEITLPTASYLTYFSSTTNTLTELSSTGDVGNDYILNDDFSEDLGDWYARLRGTVELSGDKMLITTTEVATDGMIISSPPVLADGELFGIEIKVDEINVTNPTSILQLYRPQQVTLSAGVNRIPIVGTDINTEFRHLTDPTVGDSFLLDYVKVFKRLPISTTYSVTASHQFTFNHTAPLSAADKAAIEADPNLIFRVWFNAEVLPSGFAKADMGNFFGGNEGLASGAYVQDLSIGLGEIEATNLVNHSNDMTQATWAKFAGAIATLENEAVPNGETSYTRITNNGASVSTFGAYDVDANSIGVISIASVWLRASINGMKVRLGEDSSNAEVTLSTNWEKYNTPESFTSASALAILFGIGSGDISEYFDVSQYQLENNPLPTEYIPTTTAPVTRTGVSSSVAFKEIQAYNTATRTTLANQSNVATGLKLIQDGSGRTTGTVTDNTTQWKQGANAPTGWVIASQFTITEEIGADTYTWTSDGNKYINTVASGTYVLPIGEWILNDTAFDDATPSVSRGNTTMIDKVVIP